MSRRPEHEGTGTGSAKGGLTDLGPQQLDPMAGYHAATQGIALMDRGHRGQWEFAGAAPLEMLKGIVSGTMPATPVPDDQGVVKGRATYHTVLTPKGKIMSDLWLWREAREGTEVVRAHLPSAAVGPLREHLAKLLPPRLARLSDRTPELGMVSLVGPEAARMASALVLGLRVDQGDLDEMDEGDLLLVGEGHGDHLLLLRSGDLPVPVFDILAERPVLRSLWRLLVDAGAEPMAPEAWDTLRVEAGRPAFGSELGPDVIPVEAGIHHRAIDYGKGCYTGQEVIVRIRDRGRVNRHLRRLVLDASAEVPRPGTLVYGDSERPVGEITSAADSPRRGKLALAYLRREVPPGDRVTVGEVGGTGALVEALET
jgi:folate-binding protein YgfZ